MMCFLKRGSRGDTGFLFLFFRVFFRIGQGSTGMSQTNSVTQCDTVDARFGVPRELEVRVELSAIHMITLVTGAHACC